MVLVIVAIMELEDEVTMFVGFDRDDIGRMEYIVDRGGATLPGLDMLALAKGTNCSRVITNLQIILCEDEDAFTARMNEIGEMLHLDVVNRGEIHPGTTIVEYPEENRDVR